MALKERINPKAILLELAEPGLFEVCNWPEVEKVYFDLHRGILDVNRSRDNIDPKTKKQYPLKRNIFPLLDFYGNSIYLKEKNLSNEEKENLLQFYYDPYFKSIDDLISSGKYNFFIDIHLMNNDSSSYNMKTQRADICIGTLGNPDGEVYNNRPSTTVKPDFARKIRDMFQKKGYSCMLNRPFAGGHIMMKYLTKFPCFQLEINKRLIMNSDDGMPIPEKVEKLKQGLKEIFEDIASIN